MKRVIYNFEEMLRLEPKINTIKSKPIHESAKEMYEILDNYAKQNYLKLDNILIGGEACPTPLFIFKRKSKWKNI